MKITIRHGKGRTPLEAAGVNVVKITEGVWYAVFEPENYGVGDRVGYSFKTKGHVRHFGDQGKQYAEIVTCTMRKSKRGSERWCDVVFQPPEENGYYCRLIIAEETRRHECLSCFFIDARLIPEHLEWKSLPVMVEELRS